MQIGIRHKLFFAFALTATLVVGALLLWHQWSFSYGFLNYVNKAELNKLDALRDDLEAGYAEGRNWEFIDGRERWLAHAFLRAWGDADSRPPPAAGTPA